MIRRIAVAVVLSATVLLTSCTYNDKRGRGDAPVGITDSTPKQIIEFPDQFKNVAIACDGHGHRVYSNTAGQIFVVSDEVCSR